MSGLRRRNLVGRLFGRLTVVSAARDSVEGLPQWVCVCTCGETCVAKSRSLHEGTTRSCGCLRREQIAKVRGERLRRRAA